MIALLAPTFQGGAGRWSAEQVHDTVAAIVRQPEFATPIRQSLAGRVLRYVAQQVGALIDLLRGSPSSRVIAIAAVVLIILVIIARLMVARRVDAAGVFGDDASSGRRDRRRDPWADARDRAAAGDYEAATHALYAAVIGTLARSGAVTHHPSKTSGDYARELARRGAADSRDFRSFAREADRVIFGTLRPDAEDYERLKTAATRIAGVPLAA
jgi:hypothetical protein